MSDSSGEFDHDLPDLKKLLERYTGPIQAQKENTAPLELFDPVTPPKATKAKAPKATVGVTADKAVIGIAGGLDEGQNKMKTPVTAIRKPRTVLKSVNENPEVVKEKPGPTGSRKFKGTLKTPGMVGRSVEPTKTKNLASSFRECSAIALVLDSSDSEEERPKKSRPPPPSPPALTKVRRRRKIVLDSDDEFAPDEDSGKEIEKEIEQLNTKKLPQLTIDLTSSSESEDESPRKPTVSSNRRKEASSEDEGFKSQDSSGSFKLSSEAILSYSPPRSTKPTKVLRPAGPVQRKSTTRKLDPRKKTAPLIPPSPHHPSSDLFWDEDETSSWIDTHSPTKKSSARTPFQTSNFRIPEEMVAPPKSPTKDLKEKRAMKKSFDVKKKALAEEFLGEVDDKIASGQVRLKCADTGGIRIVWSKTLRTTAGMAKWQVQTPKLSDGQVDMDRAKHYATIELSEKVIDSEEKLYNVICHEWCHLANYMISNVKKPPHGESFKQWAAQCSHAYSHLGVKVTTTHDYEIACKYEWTCQNLQCGYVYKRHSQSIDPTKYLCGVCRGGKLLQTQPVPRPITGYQTFMKQNFSRIKTENPGTPQKGLMALVGKEYREARAKEEGAKEGSGYVEGGEKEGVLEELLGGLKV
ncbi:hypothetical protein L873DRAFT_1807139 [Choiromyces venosus 120613-1]|uniref:SprT-like domain-containing protein n=1 Tax=Choiromyces venosus 120613-1 TaxID=1336337 RepID=A0A3N4JZZ8_9PEZI|nr:hypothetical protein L873DRAFT_1807139 [Choiromyces venosus 120613-1]